MSRWKITDRPGLQITYEDLLNSPQWREKKKQIMRRDGFKCQTCGNGQELVVHHKYYESGIAPWEYPDKALITWCKDCHERFHLHVSMAMREWCGVKQTYYQNVKKECA